MLDHTQTKRIPLKPTSRARSLGLIIQNLVTSRPSTTPLTFSLLKLVSVVKDGTRTVCVGFSIIVQVVSVTVSRGGVGISQCARNQQDSLPEVFSCLVLEYSPRVFIKLRSPYFNLFHPGNQLTLTPPL
jgi:hypothetical protein